MKRTLALSIPVLLLAGALASTALAVDPLLMPAPLAVNTLVQFKGGIGVIPVSSGQGLEAIATVVNRNIVRDVQPAGQIWVIRKFDALVGVDGSIHAVGRGLILGGGNNIGRAAGQSVFASLICGAVAPFTTSDSNLAGVPLTDEGDFVINDVLTPTPPTPCDAPVLLIRNAANGGWFAAGIPRANVVPAEPAVEPPVDEVPPAAPAMP
ncbi:hypothetical protein ACFW0H_28440 [Pseudomonas sp. CR3202]|uniref:hypothetical protein n=1 Tax=Pseudomonas sp. CR3202 TaxID=3351532 RepID=UPI003BF39F73